MVGSFAVLTQRGPFSRNLLSYSLDSIEVCPAAGAWYMVPYMHDVAPALLVSTDASSEGPATAEVVPLPVLSPIDADGIYPAIGPDVTGLQRALERQILGWEDALAVVRFLQASQKHDRQQTRLSAPDPTLLLHNVQTMAGRDPIFGAKTSPLRQLLSEKCGEGQLSSALWKLSTPARGHLYEQGAVVNGRLADTPRGCHDPEQHHERAQLFVGSFRERAAQMRPRVEAALAAGGSVALIVSSDSLAALYATLLIEQWGVPVIRWPTSPVRKFQGIRSPAVWVSTRQFSTVLLPDTALSVVDLGIPGEWPFYWQRFSLRSLVSIVADLCTTRSIPCLVGVSTPTLSILEACGIPLDSMPQPSASPQPVTFLVRRPESPPAQHATRSGILLEPTLRMLRRTYDEGLNSALLLNIRGLATLIECAECGYTATCPECGETLTLGSDRSTLFCKQCGHSEPPPDTCPNCHGSQLRSRGYGLDRLARELLRTFPASTIIPMDSVGTSAVSTADAPSLFLGTYADVQQIPSLQPHLIVFPDVSVGLRHPVFDNIEQLAAVIRGAALEAASGTVLVQLDRRTIDLRSALDTAPLTTFLETEQAQRRELMMPPFARQFVVRLPAGSTKPDVEGITRWLETALAAEGVTARGLHAEVLAQSPKARLVSVEFRADACQAALGLRVGRALTHSRLFQNASIRVY